ncbi:Efflux transporter, RND family, MFP subunit [Candidatus Accumulibacter aalborgensis]|uniref:Efflux transporter, RND family, MFP subunit n=1 Tax=Candidatus Accumulibacter aalborgensis TaxID=1860102 RepID=A0A1A8XJT3_9PROT|nr:efflux RND transporter periplasmic adaptor subunit [Candidatus Accumulibacter aalborgensis]SBT04657.1 Efflux transporter, RND family, MFP subunit [Candidatus Accumulibacter aalborgensis]
MSKSTGFALAAIAALAVGGGYWYTRVRQPDAAQAIKAPPPVPVVLSRATLKDMPVVVEAVGRGEAYESVSLKSRVDGQVAAVVFTEGQHVRQGDELVRLDATDFTLRLRQAEANAARDEAQLAKARADTARYLALQSRGFVSEEKVNEMRTVEAVATAGLRADQAAVELARSQLSYATIRAPFAGVVGARLIFPGAAVKINETIVAVVNRVRPLYVTFSVPEKHLPQLRAALARGGAGCKSGGCLQVSVWIPGDANRRFAGEVRFIDNAVDMTTGTIQMKAVVDNHDEALMPGQFLRVGMDLDSLPNAVVVANEAVQQGPDGPFVFVVGAQGTAEVRKIEVAASAGGLTAVAKGVQADETVVTDGQLRLTAGARVESRTKPAEPDTAAVAAQK